MVIGFGRHACRTGWDHDHFGYDCHGTCHLCVSDFAMDRKSKRGQAEELMVGLADVGTMLAVHKGNRMCRVTCTTRREKKR